MPKYAYEFLENMLNDLRRRSEKIITFEQARAVKGSMHLPQESILELKGAPRVQNTMYDNLLRTITPDEIRRFNNEFYALCVQRDHDLSNIVRQSTELVRDWNNDKKSRTKLKDSYFLKTIAVDNTPIIQKDTSGYKIIYITKSRIVPIKEYYSEDRIIEETEKRPFDFIPLFERPNKRYADLDAIEITTSANITGLTNPQRYNSDLTPYEQLSRALSIFFSRNKGSKREMIKAIDWDLGLRKFTDYPYDAKGIMGIFEDEGCGRMDCGQMIYEYFDFIKSIAANSKFFAKNIHTAEENRKKNFIKLLDHYDRKNVETVTRTCAETDNLVTRLRSNNKDYRMTSDQRENMIQGIQMKCHLNGDRAEIWIQNKTMNRIYVESDHVGHTSAYITRRLSEREDYLHNPALSDGRRDLHEGKKDAREPSLAIFAKRLEEDLFRRMFMIDRRNGYSW